MLHSYHTTGINGEQFFVIINYDHDTPIEFVVEKVCSDKRDFGEGLEPNERLSNAFPGQILQSVSIKPLTELTNHAIVKELLIVNHDRMNDSAIAVVVFPDNTTIGIEAHFLHALVAAEVKADAA